MRVLVTGLIVATVGLSGAGFAQGVPEPDGYRAAPYRAAVPATLEGAKVLDTDGAKVLWGAGQAVFIDVLPQLPKPDLPDGTVWRPPARDDIPGSYWLANVGYDILSPPMDDYFRAGLARLSDGDAAAPLVFYCQAECWMSWNAAKRAMAMGYVNIYWYPEGTDGWTAANLPLEARAPEPLPDNTPPQ